MPKTDEILKCSFCGKSKHKVVKLIAGPGVYICDQCITLCNQIIEDEVGPGRDTVLDSAIEAAAREAREALDRLRVLAQQSKKADPPPG